MKRAINYRKTSKVLLLSDARNTDLGWVEGKRGGEIIRKSEKGE